MKVLTKTTSNPKSIYQDQPDEREIWYKTVVKILCWKDGLREGSSIKATDKIGEKEWNNYCKVFTKINANSGKEKAAIKLKETKTLIEKHGGFSKS